MTATVLAETIECLVVLPPWADDDQIHTTGEYLDIGGELTPITRLDGYIPLSAITGPATVVRVGVNITDFHNVIERWTVKITDTTVTFDGPHQ